MLQKTKKNKAKTQLPFYIKNWELSLPATFLPCSKLHSPTEDSASPETHSHPRSQSFTHPLSHTLTHASEVQGSHQTAQWPSLSSPGPDRDSQTSGSSCVDRDLRLDY